MLMEKGSNAPIERIHLEHVQIKVINKIINNHYKIIIILLLEFNNSWS